MLTCQAAEHCHAQEHVCAGFADLGGLSDTLQPVASEHVKAYKVDPVRLSAREQVTCYQLLYSSWCSTT
jgi:hypothetical protein